MSNTCSRSTSCVMNKMVNMVLTPMCTAASMCTDGFLVERCAYLEKAWWWIRLGGWGYDKLLYPLRERVVVVGQWVVIWVV